MGNKTEEKGKDVAVKPGGAVAVPDFMKKKDGDVIAKGLNESDFKMPRLVLLQGLSPELQEYDGLKQGEFFHNLSEKSLGRELTIVPIYISKRYVLWNPRHAGGGILARSDDAIHWQPPQGKFEVKAYKDRPTLVTWTLAPTVAASRLDQWGSYDPSDPKAPPAATLCYVIICALPDYPEHSPVALMLQRTATGPAQKLLSKLNIAQSLPWGMKFVMTSFDDNRSSGDFKNYRFTAAGFVTEEQFREYQQMHDTFDKQGVQLEDIKGAGDDSEGPAKDTPDTGGKY